MRTYAATVTMARPSDDATTREQTKTPLVVGRYEIHERLASGGMASVHVGRLLGPAGFSRPVAIKRLHDHLAANPEFVAMLLDEARLAARVQHPNVVATLDVLATRGELFLVMEYVQGEVLSRLWRAVQSTNTPIDPRIVAAIMSNILHGLHAAHEAKDERGNPLGIVHRDVSPQNVMVGIDGTARVLDFGIAKAFGRLQLTRDGEVKGKLAYMAIEQLDGHGNVSRQADVYAAGVVCWELLTGKRLYDGESEVVMYAKAMGEPPPAPTTIVPSLPSEIDSVLATALARAPGARYPTAEAFALELERVLGVAPPSMVSAWVKSLAGSEIEARSARLVEIESSSSKHDALRDDPLVRSMLDGERLPSFYPTPDPRTFASMPISQATPDPQRSPAKPRRTLVLGIAATVTLGSVLLAVVAWVLLRSSDNTNPVAPTLETSAPTWALQGPTEPSSTQVAPVASSASAPVPPVEPVASTASIATANPTSRPRSKPSEQPPTPAPPTTTPTAAATPSTTPEDCDPPYSLDAQGHRTWKKHCLR